MIINSEKTALGYDSFIYKSGPVKYTDYVQDKYNTVHKRLYKDALNSFLEYYIDTAFRDGNSFDDFIDDLNNADYDIDTVLTKYDFELKRIVSEEQSPAETFTERIKSNITELKTNLQEGEIISKNNIYNILIKYYNRTHRIIEIKNEEYYMPSSIVIFTLKPPYTKLGPIELNPFWKANYETNTMGNQREIDKDENVDDLEIVNLDYIRGKANLESRLTGIKHKIDFSEINNDTQVSDDYLAVYKKTFSGLR